MAMPYDLGPGEVHVARHGKSVERIATLLPGIGYTADMPLLYFTGRALLERGWAVDEVWWRAPNADVEAWASAQLPDLIERIHEAATPLIVAKSLGTLAMPAVIGTQIAGIWLTPLLTNDPVASAAALLDQRHLLVGGTADRAWVESAAASSPAHGLSIDGANHNLEVGETQSSLIILTRVLARVSDFLDDLTDATG
jgi:hypothetical protein